MHGPTQNEQAERVVVTRNGRPAAVLISPDDLDSLEETLELLSDSDAVRDLIDAEASVASRDVVRGIDAQLQSTQLQHEGIQSGPLR